MLLVLKGYGLHPLYFDVMRRSCRAALKQPLDLYNIREIDASLGKTLETICASHQAWLKSEGAQPMIVDGVRVEELCLTFELPGDPSLFCLYSKVYPKMIHCAEALWRGSL